MTPVFIDDRFDFGKFVNLMTQRIAVLTVERFATFAADLRNKIKNLIAFGS